MLMPPELGPSSAVGPSCLQSSAALCSALHPPKPQPRVTPQGRKVLLVRRSRVRAPAGPPVDCVSAVAGVQGFSAGYLGRRGRGFAPARPVAKLERRLAGNVGEARQGPFEESLEVGIATQDLGTTRMAPERLFDRSPSTVRPVEATPMPEALALVVGFQNRKQIIELPERIGSIAPLSP